MARHRRALHHGGNALAEPRSRGTGMEELLKKILPWAVAAAVTALAWLLVFRPGPGRAGDLLYAQPGAPVAAGERGEAGRGALRLFSSAKGGYVVSHKVQKTEAEWRSELTPEEYHVLREKGTERAFTGSLWDNHGKGVYRCAACGNDLFTSDAKFDSGTGWPSFYEPIAGENVETERDVSLMMVRTEVHCSRCGGHLGHVFPDGPRPTGLRYCINSVSLDFDEKD